VTIRTRVVRTFDDAALSPQTWDALLGRGDTDEVFLTRSWQRSWWQAFGRGELLMVLAEREGHLVAVAPLFLDSGMLYFVGSGGSDYLDFVGDISDPEILDALLGAAIEASGQPAGAVFYHVLSHSGTRDRLMASARRLGWDAIVEPGLPAPALDIAAHPDLALAATRKKSLLRHERHFISSGALTVEHLSDPDRIAPHLDELFTLHRDRWAGTDSPSLFLDPRQQSFYRDVACSAGADGWLRFTRLVWEGRTIACHFGFSYRGAFLWYKPAFAIDLARRSPGEVLLRQLLLAALAEGTQLFDFGLGEESFKSRFATTVRRVENISLFPRPATTSTDGAAA
jgi:CelD/BcsL family acetyltransferase involved in cellulose biosynthesis